MDFFGNVTGPQTATESSDVPMDGSVAETLGATLPQASSPPVEEVACAARRLDDAQAAQLERTVRSMHPEYALVNVKRDIARKSDRVYVINVHGAGEHFCLNKGTAHSRSRVYWRLFFYWSDRNSSYPPFPPPPVGVRVRWGNRPGGLRA